MAGGIPFVVFGLMGPEGAFEIGGEGCVDVGGVHIGHAEDAVVADEGAEFAGERLTGDPEARSVGRVVAVVVSKQVYGRCEVG